MAGIKIQNKTIRRMGEDGEMEKHTHPKGCGYHETYQWITIW
jgi:hypothetical protein